MRAEQDAMMAEFLALAAEAEERTPEQVYEHELVETEEKWNAQRRRKRCL